jgi:hypothetical protein
MKALRLLGSAVLGVVLGIGAAVAPGARPAGAQAQPQLRVRIDRADKAGRTPLYVPIRVTVTEGDTGKPPAVDHVVFAAARNARGDQAGPFSLGVLELDDPSARGIHEGFVIVPYGGPWTITAVVDKAQPDSQAPPIVLARGSADFTVDAPVPAAGAAAPAGGGTGRKPQSEPFGVAVLWVHSMVAVAWFVAIGLLALLALPGGRRFLSEHGSTALDGNLDRIVRSTWWLTGLVVATGTYNLVKSVAYRVPLSADQARRLFRLPYAEPYYLALAVKLAAYAVMIGATVPLVAEARRRAAAAESEVGPAAVATSADDRSPWDNPDRGHDEPAAGGRLALRRRAGVAVERDWLPPERAAGRVRAVVAVMAVGGAVIMGAVTLLKYFHLLGELSRLAG